MSNSDLVVSSGPAVLKVVLQLKRVGQVWQDVNIYCKAMGTLLKTAASELISRILALEDLLRGRQHTARPVCAYSGAFEHLDKQALQLVKGKVTNQWMAMMN
ncbi:centromere/kinetochore protein zw10 homolog isoform X2 [Alosa pseudoharengus]|uniref:centromere/kinetochore protein zw10 homolog isoform X2 n=1 Tax=Alosa pseudoharengus TaxID=34774 RepID=UPI003F89B703